MKALALLIAEYFGTILTAHAQTTTLDYQGELMTGTSESLLSGATGEVGGLPLTDSIYAGRIVGSLTVSGQLNTQSLTLVSYNFSLIGQDGVDLGLYAGPAPLGNFGSPPNSFCGDGCIDLTLLNESIAGATLDLTGSAYHAPQLQFLVGPSGDSVFYLQASTNGTCQNAEANPNPDGTFTYTGPTVRDCVVTAGNSDPGRWTVVKPTAAPELDWSSACAALTFLLGGLAVARGRQRPRARQ